MCSEHFFQICLQNLWKHKIKPNYLTCNKHKQALFLFSAEIPLFQYLAWSSYDYLCKNFCWGGGTAVLKGPTQDNMMGSCIKNKHKAQKQFYGRSSASISYLTQHFMMVVLLRSSQATFTRTTLKSENYPSLQVSLKSQESRGSFLLLLPWWGQRWRSPAGIHLLSSFLRICPFFPGVLFALSWYIDSTLFTHKKVSYISHSTAEKLL